MKDEIRGGRGICGKCGREVNNVAFHESNACKNNMSETTSEPLYKTIEEPGVTLVSIEKVLGMQKRIQDLELQIKAKDEQLSNSMAGDEHIFLCAEIDELKKSQQTSTKASIMLADNVLRLTSQIQDLESQLSQAKAIAEKMADLLRHNVCGDIDCTCETQETIKSWNEFKEKKDDSVNSKK